MGSNDPLRIEPAFWERDDVIQALVVRDVGGLFRLVRKYAGASQHRIGTAVGIQQGTISMVISGKRDVASFEVMERVADGLKMPDEARMRFGLAPKEQDMRRRTALGIGLATAISPAMLAEVLRESAAEVVDFTRDRAMSAVGPGTLDHLTNVIVGLDRSYQWKAAAELFPIARNYRQAVERLLDGRHTLAEARELYVHGAYLSHILSDLATDLGSSITARAYAIDAFQLAEQAGHDELCSWAADSLAVAVMYLGRPGEAASAARKGLRKVPRRHPLAARLHARAAEDHARRGNATATADALATARAVCDGLPAEMPSRFGTDTAEHTAYSIATYAASCSVDLRDWKEAERQAKTALGVARWSPLREARALLDLGTALAHLGSPDEAAELGRRALAPGRGNHDRRIAQARTLDAILMNRYRTVQGVEDFHAQYEQLATRAITN